jgi:hypothetical protein
MNSYVDKDKTVQLMATAEKSIEPVTIGKLEYMQTLNLDHKLLNELGVKTEEYMLLVFHTTNKAIRVYPCSCDFAYKLIIIMNKVLPDFIGRLSSILADLNIQPIFTSALCFQEDYCSYEAYFDPQSLEGKLDYITKQIMDIQGVMDVEIKTIK